MGQAKLRGSKADRIAQGIRERGMREALREFERAERWKRMTPKERELMLFIASMQMGKIFQGKIL